MPLRNRVTPESELVAVPERGLVYGNRGCLHDAEGRIRRRYAGRRWIACRLRFRDWHRGPLLQPGRFTELFFLDEATAFSAGHRPCALCRRRDYRRFGELWATVHPGQVGADAIDAQLHRERVGARGAQLRHEDQLAGLPDGVFVLQGGVPHVVLGDGLLPWTPGGYLAPVPRPRRGEVEVLTPASLVRVLRAGWQAELPLLHPSATTLG
jgi:hypothetical protein